MSATRSILRKRRGVLTVLLVLGIPLLAIGWLRSGDIRPAADPTYREAVVGQPTRINPLAATTNQAEADLTQLIFSGLMRLRADGLPEPDLAERWEVTPDALTYTFHLRSNATWHDGAAVTADDVAFTIARIQAEDFAGPAALRADWVDVQVFVADARTILLRLPEPAADFLARATLGILPAHLVDEMSATGGFANPAFDREPVGTGPYRLVSLNDERAILRHNTSYFLGTPAIREIELRFAASDAERLEWVADGTVHGALFDDTLPQASLPAADGLVTTPLDAATLTVLYFNNLRPPLNEPATRRALAAAIDPVAAIRASGVSETPAISLFPPRSWAWSEFEVNATLPPDAMWAFAGWTRNGAGRLERDGVPLMLELVTNGEPHRIALAEAIAAQLDAVGVTVELVTAPAQRVVAEYLRPAAYSLALFGWQLGNDPDPYGGWHTSQLGAGNVAVFSDAEADALLEVARTTLDVGERREFYALFSSRFAAAAPSVVIGHPVYRYVHSASLTGIDPERLTVRPEQRFIDVHLWRFSS